MCEIKLQFSGGRLLSEFVFVQVDTNGDFDPGVLLSAQTITSETTSTTTTTHITKVG